MGGGVKLSNVLKVLQMLLRLELCVQHNVGSGVCTTVPCSRLLQRAAAVELLQKLLLQVQLCRCTVARTGAADGRVLLHLLLRVLWRVVLCVVLQMVLRVHICVPIVRIKRSVWVGERVRDRCAGMGGEVWVLLLL